MEIKARGNARIVSVAIVLIGEKAVFSLEPDIHFDILSSLCAERSLFRRDFQREMKLQICNYFDTFINDLNSL